LRLLAVVGVLLAKLLLAHKTEIMFGVLVVILGGNRIAGTLGVTRKLIYFLRCVKPCREFDVRPLIINARQRILAFAVVTVSPHALLTVSHVPVIAFCLSRRCRRPQPNLQVHTPLRGRTHTCPRQSSRCVLCR
jgi:hypothetical protein